MLSSGNLINYESQK